MAGGPKPVHPLVTRRVRKRFTDGEYDGVVEEAWPSASGPMFHVRYTDGDEEDVDEQDLLGMLVPDEPLEAPSGRKQKRAGPEREAGGPEGSSRPDAGGARGEDSDGEAPTAAKKARKGPTKAVGPTQQARAPTQRVPPPLSQASTCEWTTAGAIQSIHLENFMCHENFNMDFGPRVNFVTGENGSGKSAVLTALSVCLGAKNARATNRAVSIKDFIRHQAGYALVAVTLSNEGCDAYLPGEFGRSITIERRILPSGGGFTIRGSTGRKRALKRCELDELLDQLSVDVANPCMLMTQDNARNFLHSGKDEDKYRFYMEATLLQRLHDNLVKVQSDLATMKAKVSEKQAKQAELAGERDAAQQAVDEAARLEDLCAQRESLLCREAWAKARELTAVVAQRADMLAIAPDKEAELRAKVSEAEAAVASAARAEAAHAGDLAQAMEAMGGAGERKQTAERAYRSACLALNRCDGQIADVGSERANYTQEASSLLQQALSARARGNAATQAQATQRTAAGQPLVAARDATAAAQAALDDQLRSMEEAGPGIMRAEEAARGAYTSASRDLHEAKLQQTALKAKADGNAQRFTAQQDAARMAPFLAEVARRSREFHRPPLGPVGRYLTLHDARWGLALEVALGGLLEAFVVHDFEDARTLKEIARRAGFYMGRFSVIVYSFDAAPYVIPPHKLPAVSCPTVLSVLTCAQPTVRNVLIDQSTAEAVVMLEPGEEEKVLFNRPWPANVARGVDMRGTTHQVRRGVVMQTTLDAANGWLRRATPRLGVNDAEAAASLQDRVEGLSMDVAEAQLAAERALAALRAHETELRRLYQAKSKVDAAAHAARIQLQRAEAEAQDDDAADEAAALADQLEATSRERAAKAAELEPAQQEAEARRTGLLAARDAAKAALDVVMADIAKFKDAVGDANSDATALAHKRSLAQAKLDKYTGMMARFRQEMEQHAADLAAAEQDAAALVEGARRACSEARLAELIRAAASPAAGPAGGDLSAEVLGKQLAAISRKIAAEEKRTGAADVTALTTRLHVAQTAFNAYAAELQRIRAPYVAIRERLIQRKKGYVDAKRHTQSKLHEHFKYYMGKKGHTGGVLVDYENETLALEVVMAGAAGAARSKVVRDTKSLSGGERSYSTLAFMLALGEGIEGPFRAMDEFDIFMDAVNRRVSMDLLLSYAQAKDDTQFLFLTPQDLSSIHERIDGKFIRVQRIAAARPKN